jgi:hypothetical protein
MREELSHCEEAPSENPTTEQQKHHIAYIDTYMQILGKTLAFNRPPTQHGHDVTSNSELPEHNAEQFLQAWENSYPIALRKHVQQFEGIKTLVKEAESVYDYENVAAGHRDARILNDRLFHDFAYQYLEDLFRPMRKQADNKYDDLETSYILYTAQRVIQQRKLYTTHEIVRQREALQFQSIDNTIKQLDAVDSQVQACDGMFSLITKDWRKAVTRLHRLTAIDVKDAEKRKLEIARRFQHHEAFPLLLQMQFDVAQTMTNLGGINFILNQIRTGLKEVDDKVLDLYVATETAMYATVLEEVKGAGVDPIIYSCS